MVGYHEAIEGEVRAEVPSHGVSDRMSFKASRVILEVGKQRVPRVWRGGR